MGKFTEACMHFVPGPMRRRPKLAVALALAGAIGAVGSGLAGFTDLLNYFNDEPLREDQAYITHQQFNTLIIPLVDSVRRMETTIASLEQQIDDMQSEGSAAGRAPASTNPAEPKQLPRPPAERTIEQGSSVQQALERVQKMQQQQRNPQTAPQ